MSRKKFSWKDRIRSFSYAWAGVKEAFQTEHNTWIHLFLTALAVLLGAVFRITPGEWLALIIVIALVWMAELFNTCIEKIMDFLSREKHPQIKIIKDMAAAAVMIAAIAAVLIACIIFIPKLL